MSSSEEHLHELIHINLSLLKDYGHKILFEQDMFRQHNQPGFEEVGHALLQIIDPKECKKSLPWPLSDKKTRFEFRMNFVTFIKMINKKHPGAEIPEVRASTLQFPGGLNFLRFMCKLSTFTVQLCFNRMSSDEEKNSLLPRLSASKRASDMRTKINIVTGARYQQEELLVQYFDFEAEAMPTAQKLKDQIKVYTEKTDEVTNKLNNYIDKLDVKNEIKDRLLNIEDAEVIAEWNQRTEEKWTQLRKCSDKIRHCNQLATQCSQGMQAKSADDYKPLCLDGSSLRISPSLTELPGGGPIVNLSGELRLLSVFTMAQLAAAKVRESQSPASPVLPHAQQLMHKSEAQQHRATHQLTTIQQLMSDSREVIAQLEPIIYEEMRKKKAPAFFKHLKDPPPLKFTKPSSERTTSLPTSKLLSDDELTDFFKTLALQKESRAQAVSQKKVPQTTSRKTRPAVPSWRQVTSSCKRPRRTATSSPAVTHETFTGYIPEETPARDMQESSCRRSLYGKLPGQIKISPMLSPIEAISPEYTPEQMPSQVGSALSVNTDSGIVDEVSRWTSESEEKHSDNVPRSYPRHKRKSINDLIARFMKVKESANK